MNTAPADDAARVRMPADVDAPDKVLYGLTFRQLAILAVAAVILVGAWHSLHTITPAPVLLTGAIVLGGLAFGIAVGRRDGLPLDAWLTHAVRFARAPRALSAAATTTSLPNWVDAPPGRVALPAPLRLPASAIADDGQIGLGDATTAAIVAATTVNLALRTDDEQSALIDTFGRWLNSLTTPTQIVISAQPVDLQSAADALAAKARRLPHPAAAGACADHAAFLADLAARRDPLRRQVLITATSPGGRGDHTARRSADDVVRAMAGLGVTAKSLDGPAATAALASCADPYRPPRLGAIAGSDTVVTGPMPANQNRRAR